MLAKTFRAVAVVRLPEITDVTEMSPDKDRASTVVVPYLTRVIDTCGCT